jgi:ABC-type glutathione transport system ATPase component
VLIATADVLLASQVSDRLAILADGRIAMERARRQILGQSVAELYMNYVGRPAPRIFSSQSGDQRGGA